eukprot:m.18969 g.18969  ORF g.18969 m.18969 type:complete len:115 (+) comp11665_c0_seq1:547-891(+)
MHGQHSRTCVPRNHRYMDVSLCLDDVGTPFSGADWTLTMFACEFAGRILFFRTFVTHEYFGTIAFDLNGFFAAICCFHIPVYFLARYFWRVVNLTLLACPSLSSTTSPLVNLLG